MPKLLLALPLLLLGALPAEAHRRHGHRNTVTPPEYRVVCDQHGCSLRLKQPRLRVSSNCIWKPWTNKTICRY